MENNQLKKYASIEIGSKSVRLIYGYVMDSKVYVLHAVETNVNALQNGLVVESDVLVNAIKSLVNKVNEELNVKISEVILSLPPIKISISRESSQTATVSYEGTIEQLDLTNCLNQLEKSKVPMNYKIIDIIPISYVLDNKDTTQESPIGKVSQTLMVKATVYSIEKNIVDGYYRVIEAAGLKVLKATISPLSNAIYLEDLEEIENHEGGYFLLNIGSDISTISLINKNMIYSNYVFLYGSDQINDLLMKKYGFTFKEAKTLKEKYGITSSPSFKIDIGKGLTFNDISEVCKESIEVLITKINEYFQKSNTVDYKSCPLILTGGGSKLKGLKEILEDRLNMKIIDFNPYSFGARDKSYSTCLGAIKYANNYLFDTHQDEIINTSVERVNQTVKKVDVKGYNINEEL